MNVQFVNGFSVSTPSAPGPSAPPSADGHVLLPPSAMEAPPPYSTLPNTSIISTHTSPGRGQTAKKLCHIDFVPRLVKRKMFGKNQYETFSAIVTRANNWLEEHCDIDLTSCETMTWFSSNEKDIYSDDTAFKKPSTVVNLRGLRLWYEKAIIPSTMRECKVKVIKCETFPMRPAQNLTELVTQINDVLSSNPCNGHIISVETFKVGCTEGNLDVEETFWKENLSGTREIFFAVRVYTLLVQTSGHETIGYKDFIPSRTNRNKDNKGYELFADVMDRACRWIARQQCVTFTNIQTIPVKLKRNVSSEERCHYTEHGNRSTNFLNIIRAYFVVQRGGQLTPAGPQLEARLSYRTFKPCPVTPPTSNESCNYEDMRTMMERVNRWIHLTGATVFTVETVPAHVSCPHGSETTCTVRRDANNQLGKYLFNTRIYLNGEYNETPEAAALVRPM